MSAFRLSLDRTGKLPANLISNEPQSLVNRPNRTTPLDFGAFFTESLNIIDAANSRVLQRGVDYVPCDMYYKESMKYGKEICATILISNPAVSNNIFVGYQALGGIHSTNRTAVVTAMNDLTIDGQVVPWDDIKAKPWYFPPGPHQHDRDDVYGFEFIVAALERLNTAMGVGDDGIYTQIRADIETTRQMVEDAIGVGKAKLQAHLADKNNPHHLQAHDIDVYTMAEIDTIFTSLNNMLTTRFNQTNASLTAHINNVDNPHQLTTTQLNVYTRAEFENLLTEALTHMATGTNGAWSLVYDGVMPPFPGMPEGSFYGTQLSFNVSSTAAVFISATVGRAAGLPTGAEGNYFAESTGSLTNNGTAIANYGDRHYQSPESVQMVGLYAKSSSGIVSGWLDQPVLIWQYLPVG